MITTENKYLTKDTSFAAYLYMKGFNLLLVDIDSFPSVFVFQSSEELVEIERQFQQAQINDNIVQYHNAYRKCLRMTRLGKM